MSWTVWATDVSLDNVEETLDKRFEELNPEQTVEMVEQFDDAVESVYMFISGASLGDPDTKKFNVSISGHANPSHEPATGWANDCITVSVNQV